MDQQYDMSPEMRRLFDIKQKQRAEAKQYYQNLLYNPHRPATDGVPFDPALMRHGALNAYRFELYKKTPAFYLKALALLSPMVIVAYLTKRHMAQKEEKFRSGTIKYEDRFSKTFF